MLVMLLVGVIWLAVEARNPNHYRWLWQVGRAPAGDQGSLDTRLPPDAASPELDTFFSPTPDAAIPPQEVKRGPLTAEQLAAIRDDQPIRESEQAAWFQLFATLQSTDEAALARQSIGTTTLIQLFRQPEAYRGELVAIRGTLRGSEEVKAPKNDLGISSYHRTWVFPDDNPSNPIVACCLTLPDGFPSGMELAERVELVGFFFKRWPYQARDTLRTAPVVLAKVLVWTPAPPKPTSAEPIELPGLVGLAALIAAGVVLASWWRTRRVRPARTYQALGTIEPPEAAEPLNMGFKLRLMAEEEQEGDQ